MGHAVSGIAALAIQTENEDQYDNNDKCNFVRNGYARLVLLWIGAQTTSPYHLDFGYEITSR